MMVLNLVLKEKRTKNNLHIGIKTVALFVDRKAPGCSVSAGHGGFA